MCDGTDGDDFVAQHYVAIPGDANLDGVVDVLNDAFISAWAQRPTLLLQMVTSTEMKTSTCWAMRSCWLAVSVKTWTDSFAAVLIGSDSVTTFLHRVGHAGCCKLDPWFAMLTNRIRRLKIRKGKRVQSRRLLWFWLVTTKSETMSSVANFNGRVRELTRGSYLLSPLRGLGLFRSCSPWASPTATC